ncbi:GntR family transcriptional regulator [Primorskyibacter marinus]|uniref:GntR family transcriptional regulator n=1 Tax=Primorskyibacter marinus TaxID=1977320 RepID=UPI000E309775|nr:GntR family transcriptional regulator [Primorskyibacter marinus]
MAGASVPLRDHAYSSFTEKLLAKEITPGQIMSQRELVALTGMPLGAIREAIPRLEADGLIRTAPKRGLQVVAIDLNLVRDAFQLRRMIETEALSVFCQQAEDTEIAELLAEHERILNAAQSGVDEALLQRAQDVDWRFHDRMVEKLGNQIVAEVYRVNAIKIRLIVNEKARITPDRVTAVMQEHLPIIEALSRRDETTALAALVAHIESARRRALHH